MRTSFSHGGRNKVSNRASCTTSTRRGWRRRAVRPTLREALAADHPIACAARLVRVRSSQVQVGEPARAIPFATWSGSSRASSPRSPPAILASTAPAPCPGPWHPGEWLAGAATFSSGSSLPHRGLGERHRRGGSGPGRTRLPHQPRSHGRPLPAVGAGSRLARKVLSAAIISGSGARTTAEWFDLSAR